MMPLVPTIYIVDDQQQVLRALSRILRAEGFRVAAFDEPADFLDEPIVNARGCVLLDLAMPGMSGMDVQKVLMDRDSSLPVIYLTGHGDIPKAVEAMKLGAVDFLAKPIPSERLLPVVRIALERNGSTLSDRRSLLAAETRARNLTPRESEVMRHVIAGKLNRQTATDLGTTERTIKVHRARVMQKMGAASLPDLVRMCELLRIDPPATDAGGIRQRIL